MAFDKNRYKELFCTEVEEQLGILSHVLLELEKKPDKLEYYSILMRSAHTIKSAAATMEYVHMSLLAHALEDIFLAAEGRTLAMDSETISSLLRIVDDLTQSLISIKEHDKEINFDENVQKLKNLLVSNAKISSPQVIPKESKDILLLSVSTPSNVKVNVDKLDALMGIFEETLMLRLRLDAMLALAIESTHTITDPEIKQKLFFIDEFKSMFADLSRVLSTHQDALLSIRLVPLEQIFGQYPRMVRDLAIREGKKVEFVVTGGEVTLDRTVIDGLGGALAHLLRNAVDHGIISEGMIRLSASREKGRAKVIVEDNGGSIDYARVREVAVAQGVDTREHIALLGNDAVAELLFHPNISTSKTVTDISGRGMGLFAVRGFAQDVGGRIDVVSPVPETGVGTRFILDLPISLATVRVLLLGVRGYTFALPFEKVVRTIKFRTHEIAGTTQEETIFIEGELLSLVHLEEVLQLNYGGYYVPHQPTEDMRTGIIIRTDKTNFILEVDACVGEQNLLVKSLPQILRENKQFSGSALLSDGRTILLLDVHGLFRPARIG